MMAKDATEIAALLSVASHKAETGTRLATKPQKNPKKRW